MKQLLPILLCYVLMTSQVFAISGGPVFGSDSINPVGTYSGVIQGLTEGVSSATTPFTGSATTDINTQNNGQLVPSTALGLFNLSVPGTGTASGTFLLFSRGSTFTGTIQASIDIDSNKFYGLVSGAQYEQRGNSDDGTPTLVEVAYAAGRIIGRVNGSSKRATSSARIAGDAFLTVTFLDATADATTGQRPSTPLNCSVSGFRQSTVASTVSLTAN